MSTHTRRLRSAPPSASAETSVPHLAPHVCDANVVASPTAPDARTDGRSA